jgi:hypothetical protein
MNKTPEQESVLYRPHNSKCAHIFIGGFKGGVGKTLCGCTMFVVGPIPHEPYRASELCRRCQTASEMMSAHKGE